MAQTLLIVLLVASLWLGPATSWKLRNWRAVAFIAMVMGTMLIAGWLPWPADAILQAAVWGGATWVLTFHANSFPALTQAELEFVDGYVVAVRRVEALARGDIRGDPREHVAEFEAITQTLEHLVAPGAEWRQVRDHAAGEFRRRLAMMRLTTNPSPASISTARESWRAVDEQFTKLLRGKAGFWGGWPHLVSRSGD
jgi:hypothetical protein